MLVGLGVLGLLVLVAVAAHFAARAVVDASFVRERLEASLGDSARVSLGEVSFGLLDRRLEATDVVVARPGFGTLVVPHVRIDGLPILDLVLGDGPPTMGRIRLERPLVYYHPRGPSSESAAPEDPGAGTADRIPVVRVRELRIAGGKFLAWRPDAVDGPRQVLARGVEVGAGGLAFEASGRLARAARHLTLRVGAFRRVRSDGLVQTTFDSLRLSRADSAFTIFELRHEPTLPEDEFFRRLPEREDRIRAVIPRIEARAFDVDVWVRRGLVARSIVFDSLEVDVLTNRHVPSGREDPPRLPHSLVLSFEGDLDVDSVLVRGRIEYRDLPAEKGVRPGILAFEEFDGRVLGISNRTGAPPMVIDARMVLFGGPAEIRIEIPLEEGPLAMREEGSVGAVDLTKLNVLTVPLEGIEVQDGQLEGMRFDVTVDGRSAGGTVWVAYHDLDVQLVDRASGEGGIFQDIKSFVANAFIVQGTHMPTEEGDASPPGTVEYYVEPDDSFFTRVWAPIRTGLGDVVR